VWLQVYGCINVDPPYTVDTCSMAQSTDGSAAEDNKEQEMMMERVKQVVTMQRERQASADGEAQ
jgi:hypothetical protein